MRKRVLAMGMLICVLLMVVAGCGSVRTETVLLEDLLLPVDRASLPILPEEVVIERFERLSEKYAALAEAVEKRAPEWLWEPLARRLDEYGFPVTFPIVTSSPHPRIVCRLRGDAETYDQSIRYTTDPQALSAMGLYETADLIRSTRDLGNGWYYCLDIRPGLKHHDRYVAAAADWLEAQGYDRAKVNVGAWMVSLQSWDQAMAMARPANSSGQIGSEWLAVVRFQPKSTPETWIQCPDVILLPLSCEVIAYSGTTDVDIRNEDWFRKMVWDLLVSSREGMLYDWHMAEVELVDASDVSYVSLNREAKPYEGPLVAVTFRTVDDSILGPKRVYVRPDTLEIVGMARRM